MNRVSAPDVIPMYDQWWGAQVGHEGVRLNLKGEYGPLARWPINLRDHYSYLMLLHNPDVFTDKPEMKDWTDSMFVDELKKEQDKGYVNIGLIPASVYRAAIEHYSFKSLQNELRMETECDGQIDANVERFALRPILTDPSDFNIEEKRAPGSPGCWAQKAIRSSTILFLGDSGSVIYNPNMTTKYNAEQYLAAEGKPYAVRSHWKNLIAVSTSGAMWKGWTLGIRSVLQSTYPEVCP